MPAWMISSFEESIESGTDVTPEEPDEIAHRLDLLGQLVRVLVDVEVEKGRASLDLLERQLAEVVDPDGFAASARGAPRSGRA